MLSCLSKSAELRIYSIATTRTEHSFILLFKHSLVETKFPPTNWYSITQKFAMIFSSKNQNKYTYPLCIRINISALKQGILLYYPSILFTISTSLKATYNSKEPYQIEPDPITELCGLAYTPLVALLEQKTGPQKIEVRNPKKNKRSDVIYQNISCLNP